MPVLAVARATNVAARSETHASSKANHTSFAPYKRFGFPALIAGFAAAQLGIFAAGPAVADVYISQPSVDFIAEGDVSDVITEVEDAEIPQLEAEMGKIAAGKSQQVVAAAERELEDIEREAAMIAEEEAAGSVPSSEVTAQTGGLLNQINALKAIMRGIQ